MSLLDAQLSIASYPSAAVSDTTAVPKAKLLFCKIAN